MKTIGTEKQQNNILCKLEVEFFERFAYFFFLSLSWRCSLHAWLQPDRLSDMCVPGGEDGLEVRADTLQSLALLGGQSHNLQSSCMTTQTLQHGAPTSVTLVSLSQPYQYFLFFKLIFPSSSQHVCDCKKGYSVTTSLNKALQRGWLVLSDRAAEINNLEQLSRRGEDASFVRGGAAVCDSRIPGSCRHGGWINTLPPPTTSCEMNIRRTFTAVIHYYVLEDK